ncbi:MAG: hypothetical protein ACI4EV_09955 [Lachnospiraceae bacterium]
MRTHHFKLIAIAAAVCVVLTTAIVIAFLSKPDRNDQPTVPQPQWEDNTDKEITVEAVPDAGQIESYSFIRIAGFIEAGDYCDVRILFPSGENFIVLAKKKVLSVDGTNVSFSVTEPEIMAMSSALYDINNCSGAYVYLTKYHSSVDKATVPDYPVNHAIYELCLWNPNLNSVDYPKYMNYRDQLENNITH